MDISIPANKFQVPFRQIDLVTESQFISYCKQIGITIDSVQLRFYEKEKILLPAIRVHRGYTKHRKVLIALNGKLEWRFINASDIDKFDCKEVDPETYYMLGGVSYGKSNWLDYYIKNDMVVYPSQKPYKEEKYPILTNIFETDKSELGNPYLIFYNRYQAILLREAQAHLTIRIMNKNLFQDDSGWVKTGKKIGKFFKSTIPLLQQKMREYHSFLNFYNKVLDIQVVMFSEALNFFQKSLKSGATYKESCKDMESNIHRQEKDKIPTICKGILNKSSLASEKLTEWQELFVYKGRWIDPMVALYDYTENIPQEAIEKTQGDYKFAQDCYKIAENITWFLKMIGENPQKVKHLATGREYSICPYCNEAYAPIRKNSKTCGKKECIRDSKNYLKRIKRKMGIYD
ncbi:MAG: hypothetical protein ABIG91_00555 [Patescibacteria group bacterium]